MFVERNGWIERKPASRSGSHSFQLESDSHERLKYTRGRGWASEFLPPRLPINANDREIKSAPICSCNGSFRGTS